jgi:GrpB-like predicted nucleotidyltransferase (UPF0157 family)/N-acetylglutamate synthase-like GNAT family acetyltransferase
MKKIEVVPYNPEWPLAFEAEAVKIKQALGDNCIEVHHVGSTSVPGLIAKPKIDIIAAVQSLDNAMEPFESLGYQYRKEHEMPFRLYFTKKIATHINLHVYEDQNPEIELNILFRDFLRNSPESCAEYAKLKRDLLAHQSAHEKNNSRSTGYNLGKNAFIKNIINQTGFAGLCFRPCQHYLELQEYHRIRREQIFDRINVAYDENHSSLTAENHFHFILYKGTEIVTVAHVEFLNKNEAVIRSLATDEPYKMKGYAKHMMKLLEKWIKSQGRNIIKLHANPNAEDFYRKLGYDDMEFDDISISKDTIDLGKIL